MRIKFLLICLILTLSFAHCQDRFHGKVIDSEDKFAIPKVTIVNLKTQDSLQSDTHGHIIFKNEGLYLFKKVGYKNQKVVITNKTFLVIEMTQNPEELNEIIINTNQIPTSLKQSINSISIIRAEDIALGNSIDLSESINRAPGVFMQSGALNTNRITIRGIGSRNLFGTSKIRAYFKDIPLTNGSGESSIEDFELSAISKFEIVKGAGATIYGSGLGGTIHITPKNAQINTTKFTGELTMGSFGLKKNILNFNYGLKKDDFNAIYSNTNSDGYRENNNYSRQTLTISTNHYVDKNNQFAILMSYVKLKAFIPSSLNETDFINNPESAASNWKRAKGHEDSQHFILGVSWQHDYNHTSKQVSSVFTTLRNAYEARPFNILEENTLAYGFRTRLLSKLKLFRNTLDYTVGMEFYNDNYNYQTYQNLYQDYPPDTGSVKGIQISDFKEKRSYFNLFFDSKYLLSEKTTVVFGLNMNQTFFNLKDNFIRTPENPNQSGNYNFKPIVSPKLGVSQLISVNKSIYANISHGFSPLTLAETLLPNGQINNDIKPETGWNYEIGLRGTALNNNLNFNTSIFRMNVKNLLVPRRTESDEFIGINAGKTQHDGFEINLNYSWINNKSLSLNTFLGYTYNHFIFKDFIDETNDFSGNDLTGVPSDILNIGLLCDLKKGFYANITHRYVGQIPITDNNNNYTNSYNLTNCKLGFQSILNKNINMNAFLGINNIFDEAYASQVLINALGFGGSAPRYYYPGNPINYYGGINLGVSF